MIIATKTSRDATRAASPAHGIHFGTLKATGFPFRDLGMLTSLRLLVIGSFTFPSPVTRRTLTKAVPIFFV